MASQDVATKSIWRVPVEVWYDWPMFTSIRELKTTSSAQTPSTYSGSSIWLAIAMGPGLGKPCATTAGATASSASNTTNAFFTFHLRPMTGPQSGDPGIGRERAGRLLAQARGIPAVP